MASRAASACCWLRRRWGRSEPERGIVGTVQVVLAQPENQPHRGDVSKLLVHRRARGTGVGAALMAAAEDAARDEGKTLLVLDTERRRRAALPAAGLGWSARCRDTRCAGWEPCDTVFFYYKRVDCGKIAGDRKRVCHETTRHSAGLRAVAGRDPPVWFTSWIRYFHEGTSRCLADKESPIGRA